MVSKKRVVGRKAKPKAGKKTKALKTLKPKKTVRKPEMVRLLADPASVTPLPIRVESFDQPVPKVTIENIRGDTAIGDLLVAFPRIREVLVGKGLKLEAEEAGDIYMTLDAFSAMNGLRTDSLVEEVVNVAKIAPPQPPFPQLAAPPLT